MDGKNLVSLQVEGMTCTNCAATVSKKLKKEGMDEIYVDFSSGEVSFINSSNKKLDEIVNDIHEIGYKVISDVPQKKQFLSTIEAKFYFCLVFSIPLLLHMFINWHPLHNPWVQLILSLPVYTVGFLYFGRSAFHSLRGGVPNMDVLIFIGSLSAFVYSVVGIWFYAGIDLAGQYLFFETGTTIITLVLLGNLIEKNAVKKTTTEISALQKLKSENVKFVMLINNQQHLYDLPYDKVKIGDLLFAATGDKVPIDGVVKDGHAWIDESMITGESLPVSKQPGDSVIGGTIITEGSLTLCATSTSKSAVLTSIIEMVKKAQAAKPGIQKLADQISAVFVPVVLFIALLTWFINYFWIDQTLSESIMRMIAVLVISCPCAMGLATPTAVMVGIGKAGKHGIIIKSAAALETFARITSIIMDKTGTITDGNFSVQSFTSDRQIDDAIYKKIIYEMEQSSSHPIAKSIIKLYPKWNDTAYPITDIKEIKGHGMTGKDLTGNLWQLGSAKLGDATGYAGNLFLFKNKICVASLTISDTAKTGAKDVVTYFKKNQINTVLLSGDNAQKCEQIGIDTGIQTIHSSKLPDEKLSIIQELVATEKVAMVGDGINDAPALNQAHVGVSFGGATDIAQQSAQILLMNQSIDTLRKAHIISKQTYLTIKQNLFWAFFYNVIAIPFAAAGFLHPMIAAASMALSDVVVIGNAIRLRYTKIK